MTLQLMSEATFIRVKKIFISSIFSLFNFEKTVPIVMLSRITSSFDSAVFLSAILSNPKIL